MTERVPEELLEIIDRFDGVIAGDDPFTARVLERGARLKVVARWGVGVDAVDLEADRPTGIFVMDCAGELHLGHLIAVDESEYLIKPEFALYLLTKYQYVTKQ